MEPKELLAVQNGESRLFVREWENSYVMTLNNQKTGEEVILVVEAGELYGRNSVLKDAEQDNCKDCLRCRYYIEEKEKKRRERALNLVAMIFWNYPEEPIVRKVEQLRKMLMKRGIVLQEAFYVNKNFTKTELYPKPNWLFKMMGEYKFVPIGSHKKNVRICICVQ